MICSCLSPVRVILCSFWNRNTHGDGYTTTTTVCKCGHMRLCRRVSFSRKSARERGPSLHPAKVTCGYYILNTTAVTLFYAQGGNSMYEALPKRVMRETRG